MSTAPEAQTAATEAAPSSTNLYTFVAAQLRTRFVPGGGTEQVYQVTAQTSESGIYYFHNFRPAVYEQPGEVVAVLNQLASVLETWNAIPGVAGISAVQVIDTQDQFVNMLDVTVDSTSGDSSTVIRTGYPGIDASLPGTVMFTDEVNAARATLDAVENA